MELAFMAVVGAFAQFVDGSLGMGYGVSSASLLTYLGYAPAVVSASVHVAKVVSGLTSGVAHLSLGNVDRRVAGLLAASGSVGAVIGATLLLGVAAGSIRPVVATILLVLGVRIYLKFYRRAGRDQAACSPQIAGLGPVPRRKLLGVGLAGGVIDAMGGGGWGPICTPALADDDRLGPRKAIGSVNLAEFVVALTVVAVLGFGMGWKGVPWPAVGMLVLGALIAAPAAAWTCSRLPTGPLGMGVGALLVALNTRTLLGYVKPVEVRLSFAPQVLWIPVIVALVAFAGLRWLRSAAEGRDEHVR